jgi:hypothetical protein
VLVFQLRYTRYELFLLPPKEAELTFLKTEREIYTPEMIFGHLLTGSNYDDEEAKTIGGRNGYGAPLCNVFRTVFTSRFQYWKEIQANLDSHYE